MNHQWLALILVQLLWLSIVSSEDTEQVEESYSSEKIHQHKPYRHLGCFGDDSSQRAMYEQLGEWNNVSKCAEEARKKSYEVFGVQQEGCWSSKNASLTFAIYGNSSGCVNGTGGEVANDVYKFIACPSGYININAKNPCQPCAVDTYKVNNFFCKDCQHGTNTWGRLGVDNSNNCTAENPIKVYSTSINILPKIRPGKAIGVFIASYGNNSLVIPPLLYSISSVQTSIGSRGIYDAKTDTLDDFNSCHQFDKNVSHPFCIFKSNGSILVNKNFSCEEGSRFLLTINVTDSANDSIGVISNPNGTVTVACTDPCKDTRQMYYKANSTCAVCNPIKKHNISFPNNGSSEMQVRMPSKAFDLYSVHLMQYPGRTLSTACYLEFSYNTSNGKTESHRTHPGFNFSINETVKSVILTKPLRLTVTTFTFAVRCNNGSDAHALANISNVRFTMISQRIISCTSINETCLDSLYKWKNKAASSSQCREDAFKLMDCYGKCIEKPIVTEGPKNRLVSHGETVRLYINVSSIMPYTIEWKRNNVKMGSNQTLLVNANTTNQGYYSCTVTTAYGFEWTRRVNFLIRLTDYFTSYVSMKLEIKYPNSTNLIDKCSFWCKELIAIGDGKYTTGPCKKTSNWDGHIGLECTIYGKRSQSLDEYYDNLRTELEKFNNAKAVIMTITVRDADFCLKRNTGTPSFRGIFEWRSIAATKKQTLRCPYGPNVNIMRICKGNFSDGANWMEPNAVICNIKAKDTGALDKLNKTKVDSKNAKEVAVNLTKIFTKSSSKNLTGNDASVAANLLEGIVSITEKLNETAQLVLEVIDTIMDMDQTVLASRQGATSKVIKVLDKVAEHIPLEEGKTSKVLRTENLVLQANKVSKNSFNGMNFGVKSDGSLATTVKESVVSVGLPRSVLDSSNMPSSRIGFIYFDNNKLFQSELDGQHTRLSENTLSSSVYNTNTSSLSEPLKLKLPMPKGNDSESLRNSSCVYWNEQGREWLRDGCDPCENPDSKGTDSVLCCCDHMTNFAVLFSPQASITPKEKSIHTKVLRIITYIGCGISLLGVVLTFLTYLLFRHLRKTNQQPIIMNICVAIGLLLIVFVAGINSTGNNNNSNTLGCKIVAILLHYLTLVVVLWMGIEAYNLYLQIVRVMAIYQRKFMLKAAIVGWGAPLLVVAASVAAAVIQYQNSDGGIEFYYGNKEVCILHNHLYRIIGWFIPILIILILNFVTFIIVIRKLNSTGAMTPVETKSAQRKRLWTAFAILCLLGLTWLFGAFAISDARIVFEYLFCIFNSLQGIFIFFFHCVRIPEVRKQWSFFVSGLGFSHKDIEPSQPRSRGIGESRYENGKVQVKSCRTPESANEAPRKGTVFTTVEDHKQNGEVNSDLKKTDIELDNVNSHSNNAMDEAC